MLLLLAYYMAHKSPPSVEMIPLYAIMMIIIVLRDNLKEIVSVPWNRITTVSWAAQYKYPSAPR